MKKRPSAQILCVGTELLLGNVLDTNSHTLSIGLAKLGINLYYRKTVGDNRGRLVSSIKQALGESDILILSGGMGSTVDDLTVECVAESLNKKLVLHEETLEKIKGYYAKKGTVMSQNNVKQAFVPEGAQVFQNRQGMAPCIIVETKTNTVIILPGPPRELEPLFFECVYPYLAEKYPPRPIVSKMIRMWGIAESKMDEMAQDLTSLENPTVAPYAKNGEAFLRISASADSEEKALELIKPVEDTIYSRFGDFIWTGENESFEGALVKALKKENKTISFAESLTGGLCAKRITDISGASEIMKMSVVTYSNEAKEKLLDVKKDTLDKFTCVSFECAEEMAEGIRRLSGADIGISTTGVAGPDTCDGNPVGLMYVGISTPEKNWSKKYFFPYENDREHVRLLSSSAALSEALFHLLKKS